MILKISELSLVVYLVSECFDKIFYSILNRVVPVMQKRLEWYPIVVILVFVFSLIVAQFIVWIYNTLGRGMISLRRKFMSK